jgi:hypothetical protein
VTGEQASLAALAATVVACLLVIRWLARHTPRQSAEWEKSLPELTEAERAEAAAVATRRAEAARARGESPDDAALLARALREARIARFRATHRVY